MAKLVFRWKLRLRAAIARLGARLTSGEEREALETLARNLDRVREAA